MSRAASMATANILMLKKAEDKRQQAALLKAFEKADVNGDGQLSVEEYYNILQENHINCTKEEIKNLIEIADKNNDGFISQSEFVGVNKKVQDKDKKTIEVAERAFSLMDRNHDGFISKQEMLQSTKNLTEKQIRAVFKRNDANKDGKLDKSEFTEMMCHQHKPDK